MLELNIVARVAATGVMLTLASPVWPDSIPTPKVNQGSGLVVFVTEAPIGTEGLAVQWVKIETADTGVMLAAVARPQGTGPFAAVLILHGSHGFAKEYVQLALAMARGGLVGVAACWFSGGSGAGSRFIAPVACPDAPPMSSPSSPVALHTVDTLVEAVRFLPLVHPDRVALFGHSRGGGATLQYILGATTVRAAVLHSAGYPPELRDRASEAKVPILMQHGTADSPDDGGSAFTNVQMARAFEAALRRAGKEVEATYYDGGGHNGIFTSATQRDSEVQRMLVFLRPQLLD